MKHDFNITIILLIFFFITQIFGLSLIALDIDIDVDKTTNETVVNHSETVVGERPDMEPQSSFVTIIIAIAIGTLLALLIIKLKTVAVWKAWFFLAIFIASSVALGVFLPTIIALIIAFILSLLKFIKPNFITHNITEFLIYPGIALIFVPILDVFWALMLLLLISVYDAFAVWKSKHMITMAKFQSSANTFAGILIPYKRKSKKKAKKPKTGNVKKVKKKVKNAILGGGDIAFPLIFSGVVMESLIINHDLSILGSLLRIFIITITVTIALAFLFFKGKKDRFYPAMPFLTAGCLVGYLLVLVSLM